MFSSGSFFGLGGSVQPREPEPYGGQKVCPVTGAKLGSMGPVIPVETSIGAKQPSLLGKMFGRKPTPGVAIYVCCQDCVAKVKNDPVTYVVSVIAERGGYSTAEAAARSRDGMARK